MPAAPRFRDPRATLYDYLGQILVTCPRCAEAAYIEPVADSGDRSGRAMFVPRKLVCRACGLARTWSGRCVSYGNSASAPETDPYFHLPLRLQARTRHGWVWAYNREHLALIRGFVEARLRERAPRNDTGHTMTLLARLPAWIKRAHHRDEVLRAVDRISRAG
ncbi:hypothetical protein [Streptomyces sp. NBC_01465]|uniref:hypothetical protein n=1 Tax=Streptomyces sp. NBC_01465 TaxID=2903878 RepID=UPI002E36F0D2|nr:hypothetical protein [Streptomyces sp. NBC_01465]